MKILAFLVVTLVVSFTLGLMGSVVSAAVIPPSDIAYCGTVQPPYPPYPGRVTSANTYNQVQLDADDPNYSTSGNFIDHKYAQILDCTQRSCGILLNAAKEIVWDMGIATKRAYLIPAIDHGFQIDPKKEAKEARLLGSDNPTGPWGDGVESTTFNEGSTDWVSDDFTTLWTFSRPYRYIMAVAGGTLLNDADAEIDAVCAPPQTPPTPTVNLDIRKWDTDPWADSVSVNAEDQVELKWESSNATRCVSGNSAYFITGASSPASGTQRTVEEPTSGDRTYSVTCYNGPSDSDPRRTSTATVTVFAADPTISANPAIVDYGTSSTVSWLRNGHTGCSVTRAGDTVGGDTDGSVATGPLYGETTYTITCTDTGASASVTIRVRPRLEEI